jgi:peptide/nickel transport system substrate-binding protein
MKGEMMRSKMLLALTTCLACALLFAMPVASQGGSGLIIEANPNGTEGIGSLNPLRCDNPACRRITDFLFPTLFAVDSQTGLLVGASASNYGLAVDVPASNDETYTLTLRDDLTWSDGTPITAYDVFYSYLAIASGRINSPYSPSVAALTTAARVVDDHTIEFALPAPNCAIPVRMNFPIVPAHSFDPGFAETIQSFDMQGDLETRFKALWEEAYPKSKFDILNGHAFDITPAATAGIFALDDFRPMQDIRLTADGGAQAFVFTDLEPGMSATDMFLQGDTNILINPPLERRADLKAKSDVQIAEFPGQVWDFIAFNVADPNKPQPAIGIDDKILDQGHHPLFGDVRVRHAIQMAIDVNELIEISLLGYGTPLPVNRIPGSWAYNADLQPIPYDLIGAGQLLEAAGWKDADRDGIRECRGCLYANEGQPLSFDLMVMQNGRREVAAQFLSRQLRRVGISVNPRPMEPSSVLEEARSQRFDAYMGGRVQRFPADPDLTGLLTREGDVVNSGSNAGSYYNPQVDDLMNQALTLASCESDQRAEIYGQIQAIFQEDQPYAWLYAQNDMIVASGGVMGFDPLPNQPFWNIRDWIVVQ